MNVTARRSGRDVPVKLVRCMTNMNEARTPRKYTMNWKLRLRIGHVMCLVALLGLLSGGATEAGHGTCSSKRGYGCDAWRGCHGWYPDSACRPVDRPESKPKEKPPPPANGGPPEPPKEQKKKAEAKPLGFRSVAFQR